MPDAEKVIKGLEWCMNEKHDCYREKGCPYENEGEDIGCKYALHRDALALLKAQEPVKPNGKQYQCNKCKFYQGVHNVMGHAPCSFLHIGGVMWNDYCSRFSQFTDE